MNRTMNAAIAASSLGVLATGPASAVEGDIKVTAPNAKPKEGVANPDGSVNLLFHPAKNMLAGAELLHGTRENKDVASGSDTRVQFTAKFDF